jgi:carbon monoxide dehydrogenase subunit G
MDLTSRFTVAASVDDAWAAFSRLSRLEPCFPGATLTSTDGDDFTGSVKVKLGPLALVYEGTGRFRTHYQFARRLEIEFHGQDRRGNGAAELTVAAGFTDRGGSTEIAVHTDLTVTGRPAQLGDSVISDVHARLIDQFASCVAERIADGSLLEPDPVTTEPVVDGDSPTVELGQVVVEESGATEAAPDELPEPAPRRARIDPPTPPRPPAWVPHSNTAETDLEVLRRVVPPLLKRFWPVLAGGAAVAWITGIVLRRARR